MEYVITFKNTNFAIKAEQSLLAKDLRASVMPLPSQIRAGCGICIRINEDDREQALAALAESGIDDIELYTREGENGRFTYNYCSPTD